MNFLNLYYFCVTAQELSFTKASRRLFISQQSLSNHISKLEAEFHVVLFHRTQPISLTEAGECLYRQGEALLNQKRQTEQALQDIRDFRSGELTIGATTSRGAVMLPKIIPQFREKFPQIALHLIEGITQDINDALYAGKTDVNLGFAIQNPDLVQEELLHKEHLVCAVPKPIFSQYLQPEAAHLRQGTFQDFKRFHACPFLKMPSGVWLGDVFEHCCVDNEVTPEVVLETSSMATLISLCASGLGAMILPESFVREHAQFWASPNWQETVLIYPLDYPLGVKSITVSWLKNRYQTRAAKEFIRMARDVFTY